MVVPIPIATPSTAAMIGLTLCASEYRNLVALLARGVSASAVPAFKKSSRSLPAVNTPEPPVMMKQRISGLCCAVSIASLMARYMSWVIAFFFSGRRIVITRVASSSVTIRWGMLRSLDNRLKGRRWRLFEPYPTSCRGRPILATPVFNGGAMTRGEHAMQLTGIHHLTAISAKPRENLAFYRGLLGMRLVKKTVNQDDVSAYHLFYADGKANPGTDLTFFDFPAAPERRGTNSISRTSLRVAGEKSLGFWRDRLKQAGGVTGDVVEVDGRLTLPFEDKEGQRLVLVDDGGNGAASPWEKSAVPSEHQVRGLGPIVLTVQDFARTALVLTEIMNMRRVRDYAAHGAHIHVFEMGEGGPAAELHILEDKDSAAARQGAGGVHHVAFRTPDEAQYHGWTARLNQLGVPNSGEIDRFYFRSLYFREPNGILFEIATDGPGFATDEPMETLGEKLALPPFLEGRRKEIEKGLKEIG